MIRTVTKVTYSLRFVAKNDRMTFAIAVNLEDYNPEWPRTAVRHAASLSILGRTLLTVHHIGSTAIPGMAAKPIMDLMPIVSSLDELDSKRGLVESVGYEWRGEFGVDGRRFCTLADAHGERVAQLHFYVASSPHARRQLAFRDYLRAFPEYAAEYETEKRRARDLHPLDSHAYSTEKGAWIRATEAKALDWFVGDVLAKAQTILGFARG
jgi:GrpB-like predicted nucleotidyltransferase (UPF0157 family)